MNRKFLALYFIGFAAVCTGLRLFLKFASIDPSTGFYERFPGLSRAFGLLVLAGAGGCLLLGLFRQSGTAAVPPACRIQRIAAALVGLACFPIGVLSLNGLSGQLSVLQQPLALPALLIALLSVLISFFCVGIAPFVTGVLFLQIAQKGGGEQPVRFHGLYLLAPLAWQLVLLLSSFMKYTAIRSVSDQMLTTVMLILLCPFLLAHARILGQIDPVRGIRQAVPFGFAFALLALCACAGMFFASIAGRGVDAALSPLFSAFYLLLGVYAAVFCLRLAAEE